MWIEVGTVCVVIAVHHIGFDAGVVSPMPAWQRFLS